ncbi:hypothetical protein AWJ20_4506 [Sugiyamaella lignohabitans]|uniref:DUF7907 domain-containing protein n=1 Tax=Sugiyamaella lignohabitans TaxID=796027 RepID=A0A167CH32_9ASCO|nr:uncharacterized protein AWJ20_4506 [Sugiyamaella lignohabitans]ANB11685.1 hypothetical protein AWJ20_4506 [Sugiyamaella lignohabitans]
MKFTLLNTAAVAAVALNGANALSLVAQSSSGDLNGAALSSIHEGAAIDYVTLSPGGESLSVDLNTTASLITYELQPGILQWLAVVGGVLQFYPEPVGDKFTVGSDGTLSLNGTSSGFYACQNINDPYNYQQTWFVLYSASGQPTVGDSCTAVTLASGSASASNATTTTVTSAANAVETAEVTVTDCPESVTNCPARATSAAPAVETTGASPTIEQTNGSGAVAISALALLGSLSAFFL